MGSGCPHDFGLEHRCLKNGYLNPDTGPLPIPRKSYAVFPFARRHEEDCMQQMHITDTDNWTHPSELNWWIVNFQGEFEWLHLGYQTAKK